MSITGPIKPYPDRADGFVVPAAEYNNLFDTLYNWLNNVLVTPVNALLAAPASASPAQNLFPARLTAVTGVPFPIADTTTSTIYLTALGGNLIGVYNTTSLAWDPKSLTADISLAVPSSTRGLYDIWVNWTGSALALSATAYNSVAATNNPAAAATPVAINTTSTSMFAVGDVISVSGGGNSEEVVITAISAGVSITVDSLANSYTTPTLWSNQPLSATTTQDGVLVKATDKSFRYVATVMVVNSTVIDSRTAGRCIGNFYNRMLRPVRSVATGTSYTAAASYTGRAASSKVIGQERILFVSPLVQETPFTVSRQELTSAAFAQRMCCYETIDNVDIPVSMNCNGAVAASFTVSSAVLVGGKHIIDDYVSSSAPGTVTFLVQTSTSLNGNAITLSGFTDGLVLN